MRATRMAFHRLITVETRRDFRLMVSLALSAAMVGFAIGWKI